MKYHHPLDGCWQVLWAKLHPTGLMIFLVAPLALGILDGRNLANHLGYINLVNNGISYLSTGISSINSMTG